MRMNTEAQVVLEALSGSPIQTLIDNGLSGHSGAPRTTTRF
jgi:hypothetical protein